MRASISRPSLSQSDGRVCVGAFVPLRLSVFKDKPGLYGVDENAVCMS